MLILPKTDFKKIRITLSSVRLDAVISKSFNISRKNACRAIKNDNVKLNWKVKNNAADKIKQGDTISFKGKGRLEIIEIGGETKKGRTAVIVGRYN
jgi:RNA-binding protein YlmH